MFDLDEFIDECKRAVGEPEPWLAVRELLAEALTDRASIVAALPVTRAELVPLHRGPEVTVFKVVWAPGMTFPPHDHLTWACVGLYGGSEANRLYRVDDGHLVETGGLRLDQGSVGVLDETAVHGVANPSTHDHSAAIHVYGGDFARLPRSNWIGDPPRREPASVEVSQAMFERANRSG